MTWGEGFSWRRKGVSEEVETKHHDANLHDEDEDRAGEKTDLATGRAIDNSGEAETADTKVYEFKRLPGTKDALGAIATEKDPEKRQADFDADNWLAQNDPDHRRAA